MVKLFKHQYYMVDIFIIMVNNMFLEEDRRRDSVGLRLHYNLSFN